MRHCGVIVSLSFLLWLCACGGSPTVGGPVPAFTIVSGDWTLPLVVPGSPPDLRVTGGFLTQNGASISGTLHMISFPCLDPFADDLVVTGTVSSNTLTLSTAPLRGQVLSLTLRPSSGQSGNVTSLEGSGNLTGPCGFSASTTASLVPPMNGTFKGSFTSGLTGDVTANLSQSGPDAHGYFHVTGDLAFSGTRCFASATIVDSIGFGGAAFIHLNTSDSGRADLIAVHAVSATFPDEMLSTFVIHTGTCANQVGSVILKKQ